MENYVEPNWGEIYYDFLAWGIEKLSGWPIAEIPSHLVLQAHNEISLRKAKEINALNHAASFVAAISQTEPGKRIKNEAWLPYRLGSQDLAFIDFRFASDLLAEIDQFPAACVADLENAGILPHCREVIA